MFKLEHVLLLKEDEKVKALTKRHALALVPGLALALLLIVAPFFFLFPLFKTGPTVLIVVGLIVAVRSFVMWDGDVFIVTNLRIVDVDQKGLFSRTVSEVKLSDIQDVSWSKNGIVNALFNVGALKVQTSSGALVIEAVFIPRPQEVHNLVNDLRHDATPPALTKTTATTPHRDDILKRVASRIESLDDAELSKLDRTLKQDDRDIAIKKLFGDGEDEKLKPLDNTS